MGGGGLITDPNYEFNLDPSIWGNTDTNQDNFGGGEIILPEDAYIQ